MKHEEEAARQLGEKGEGQSRIPRKKQDFCQVKFENRNYRLKMRFWEEDIPGRNIFHLLFYLANIY